MIGTTIKDFKLVERLGKGGWGEVWAAEQPIVRTRVAIKLLRSEVSGDEAHVQRFFREAIAVGGIPHAGIVKIFDVGWERGQAFLIMELLAGEALTTRIRRETRLPLDEVIDLGRQIASVLAATHAAGVVHRDLKPDNVFLVPDAELGERVKVLDFGIAKLSTVNVTGTGSLGTPAYMAPEQWNNPAAADDRADLYSLGCVLFEMCCGRPPFLATTPGEACTKHLTEPPVRARTLAPAIPPAIDDLIDRLLAKRPEERATLADVDRVLAAAAVDAPRVRSRASHPPVRPTPATTGDRHVDGNAATLTSGSTDPVDTNGATVTSLAGAVIHAQTLPPARRRVTWLIGGGLALGAAGVIGFAATRAPDEPAAEQSRPPEVVEPTLGMSTIATWNDPTPETSPTLRSEQAWLAAREDFARACERQPTPRSCAGAELATGELALLRDEIPAAVAAMKRATTSAPRWSAAFLGLAEAATHAGEIEVALVAARQAQALEPTAWQPAMASARALIARDVDDALIEYRRAMSLAPADKPLVLAEIALAFHFAQRDDEARRLAQRAVAIAPNLVNVRIIEAERALEAGDATRALVEADAALALSPKNAAAVLARGDALALLGRADEAAAAYRRVLEIRGGLNLLALSKTRLAEVEAAIARHELPPPRDTAGRAPAPATPKPPSAGSRSSPVHVPGPGSSQRSQPSPRNTNHSRSHPPMTDPPKRAPGRDRTSPIKDSF